MTKLYIDADYLAHRFTWNRSLNKAKKECKKHIDEICAELWADEATLVLAGRDNFRKELSE